MKCAYCGNEAKGTKEHIISKSVLDLFPECFITFDGHRNVIHEHDPMIKDVCANCNNNLISYIDSYANEFISKYFLNRTENEITIEYNYVMLQKMLLKYTFNDLRSKKMDCSYFDQEIISFILDQDNVSAKKYIFVLGGTVVNNSPLPDSFIGNLKLQWLESPIFYEVPCVRYLDYETGEVIIEDKPQFAHFNKLKLSALFRFNSGEFIIMCWDKEITDEELARQKVLLEVSYPYAILSDTDKDELPVCTDEISYVQPGYIHLKWDFIHEVGFMRKYASDGFKERNKLNNEWFDEEKKLAVEHSRNREKRELK